MGHIPEDELDSLTRSLLLPSPGRGVYARTALFEQVIEGLTTFISRHREPETQVLRFPPVMSRSELERSGYLHSFPHLLGGVSCLKGSEAKIRAVVEQPDWANELSATELVLSPAACYPVYPLAAAVRADSGQRSAVRCSFGLFSSRIHARDRTVSIVQDARVRMAWARPGKFWNFELDGCSWRNAWQSN